MKNIPNILSVFRICLVPVFILLFYRESYVASAVVVAISAITDIADGYIARKFNLVSVTGQVLDPLADKLMQISVIIVLWFKGLIPDWAICIMAGKEFVMIIGGCILYFFRKKSSIPAMWYGKFSTCLFYVSVMVIILWPESSLVTPLIALTVVAMLFSLCMYLMRFINMNIAGKSVNN